MEYYKLLQLDREPFSNSPDPDYFFQSGQHLACLQKLELALRLKRGLNVVIGDVGTGKTTLCRQLIRKISHDHDFESHLILDPSFSTSHDFLRHIHTLICDQTPPNPSSALEMKESIKQILLEKGVHQGKTLVLIIDEGQKIPEACIEILREFLNFETNTYKLLQIVIFAQLEFQLLLDTHANFADRINLLHHLQPMNFKDSRQMVQHRLKLAGTTPRPKKLFTFPAMWAIYRSSKGYPRKIIHLCHQSLLAMIIQNRSKAGWRLIHSCQRRIGPSLTPGGRSLAIGLVAAAILLIIVGFTPEFISRTSERAAHEDIHMKTPAYPVPKEANESAAADKVQSGIPLPQMIPSSSQESAPHGDMTQPVIPANSATAAVSSPAVTEPGPRATQPAALDDTRGERPSDFSGERPSDFSMAEPPALLGHLVVKPGDTMVGLVQAVYGVRRNSLLRAVIEANPNIADPNSINIGDVIAFPALPTKVRATSHPCWWIVLETAPTLQDARHKITELSGRTHVPLQIIPSWSLDTGLRFQITLKGYYTNEDAALKAVRAMPERIAASSAVISNWPQDTTFFASPTRGGVVKNPNNHEAFN